MIRVVAVGDGWALIGFANAKSHTQEASVYIKVAIESVPKDVWIEVNKEIDDKCAEGNPLFQDLSGIIFNIIDKSTNQVVGTMETDPTGYAKSDKLVYSDAGFDVIEFYVPEDLPLKRNTEPVFVKPDAGKVKAIDFHNNAVLDPLRLQIRKRNGNLEQLKNGGVTVDICRKMWCNTYVV